jgi:hypothetical protein
MWRRMILLLLVCAACSSESKVRLEPVRGQVLYKDKPLHKAVVAFHPLGDYPVHLPKPIAYTDAEGRFTMTTFKPGDGVPAGEYAITVEYRERSQSGIEKIGGKNLLPARYSKPETSGLRCKVEEGDNELPVIKLTEP